MAKILEEWHCTGSRTVGLNRIFASAKCYVCGKRMAERGDGLLPLHTKPGAYHPNRVPKSKPQSRIKALEDAVSAVRSIHERGIFTATGKFFCKHCRAREVEWPCPTIKALDGLS